MHVIKVIIGVDPHKLSATIELVDKRERLLRSGPVPYRPGRLHCNVGYAKSWPERVWAVDAAR